MKNQLKKLAAAVAIGALATLAIAKAATPQEMSIQPPQPVIDATEADPLSIGQRAWLGALEWCESRGNPDAINKVDRDGTASYGLLQFKPRTFRVWAAIYEIQGELMDPEAQEAIVIEWILKKGSVDWRNEFPDCVKRLGVPPSKD